MQKSANVYYVIYKTNKITIVNCSLDVKYKWIRIFHSNYSYTYIIAYVLPYKNTDEIYLLCMMSKTILHHTGINC